jgi:hypothetical protein
MQREMIATGRREAGEFVCARCRRAVHVGACGHGATPTEPCREDGAA